MQAGDGHSQMTSIGVQVKGSQKVVSNLDLEVWVKFGPEGTQVLMDFHILRTQAESWMQHKLPVMEGGDVCLATETEQW